MPASAEFKPDEGIVVGRVFSLVSSDLSESLTTASSWLV